MNIGYHTRLIGNNSVKIAGGSFGGSLEIDTANRLVNAHFDVIVKNSGRPVFVDKEGREVSLYITVDPSETEKGKAALYNWRSEQNKRIREDEEKVSQIEEILSTMSNDEIIERLKR